MPARFPNATNGSKASPSAWPCASPPQLARTRAASVSDGEASREEPEILKRSTGPDFHRRHPRSHKGIEDRTGRGSITQRAVVNVEETLGRPVPRRHRAALPGPAPDNLADKIAQLVDGAIGGITRHPRATSVVPASARHRPQARRRRPRSSLNNLYKHFSLQENFSANFMLALVDGVRTCRRPHIAWITHQMDHRAPHATQGPRTPAHPRRLPEGPRPSTSQSLMRSHRRGPRRPDQFCSTWTPSRPTLALQLRRYRRPRRRQDHGRVRRTQGSHVDTTSATSSPSPRRQRAIISTSCRNRRPPHPHRPSTKGNVVIPKGTSSSPSPERLRQRTTDNLPFAEARRKCAAQLCARGDVVEHFFVTTTHNWLFFHQPRPLHRRAYEIPKAAATPGPSVASRTGQPDPSTPAQVHSRSAHGAPFPGAKRDANR